MDECPKRPLLLRLGELERAIASKPRVADSGQETQKKREGDLQRQLASLKKQLREEMEAHKEQVTADCLRLREKITAQEAKLRDVKPKADQVQDVHQDLEHLRGEVHSMKQQLTSGISQLETAQPAPTCSCPNLKDEMYRVAGDIRQQVEQQRREISTIKSRLASNAVSERAPPKPRPPPPPPPSSNLKQELDQLRKHFDLEMERNRQDMLQERAALLRERIEIEQRLASLQPRIPQRLPDSLSAATTLPPVLVLQRDMWGVYEFQDLWTKMRKAQRHYNMFEVRWERQSHSLYKCRILLCMFGYLIGY